MSFPGRCWPQLASFSGFLINAVPVLLENKRLVVIGGTTGLGLSAAGAFVREGGRVVVLGQVEGEVSRALEVLGASAVGVVGDATEAEANDRAVAECVRCFGGLDGLYHVAGGSGRKFGDGPLDQVTDEGWERTLRWNLNSVAWSNRAALRQLLCQGTGGSIVNLSSVLALSPSPGHFETHAYATAKAGIVGLSRSLAASYAPRNIRVNVVAPALTDTPMSRRAVQDPAIQSFVKTKQPLDGGRMGLPEDIDGLVVFLMGDQAKFITGQVIGVDGGWSVSEGQYAP
ncbi:MAG: SDR family oxidoreductase [Verrucomicrobia bacterium]|nr:SDR family oxidoreductase [Verrucomicrobiota bacterium]